jgi:integrase
MKLVEAPKPEKQVVFPFERHEVEAMLRSTEMSLPYTRPGKRTCSHALPLVTSHRDRSIMLLLVDTGIRASELCGIKVEDIGSGGIYS